MKVKPELFLDDVGRIVRAEGGCHVWEVRDLSRHRLFAHLDLPPLIYVVDFPGRGAGQEFLLGRHICGPQKFLLIREIGHRMMRLFKPRFTGRAAQFVILWGGRPLDMLDADPPIFDLGFVDTTYIKLTRVEDPAAPRGWGIVESARVGEWWPDDTWIVMEECLASGNTLAFFAAEALRFHKPKKLFIFPVCASAEGLEGINAVCRANGVEFIPVLNEAVIQVAVEGTGKPYTDLGLQPRTLVCRDFYPLLAERYQERPLCFVGDIGDSLYKAEDYIIETLRDMRAVGMDFAKEDFTRWHPCLRSEPCRARIARELGAEILEFLPG